jgi:hypothetical protein
MTLPDERYRAVVQTKRFLLDILTTPRIPKEIKEGARRCLRHYPDEGDLDQAAETSPHVFAKQMEDVTRLFKKYEELKAGKNEN